MLFLALFFTFSSAISNFQNRTHLQQINTSLKNQALILKAINSNHLTNRDWESVNSTCKQLGVLSGRRFSVALSTGQFIGDSRENPYSMTKRGFDIEMVNAIEGNESFLQRFSEGFQENMWFYSLLDNHNDADKIIFRVGARKSEFSNSSSIFDAAKGSLIATLIFCLLIGLLKYKFNKNLLSFSNKLSKNDFSSQVSPQYFSSKSDLTTLSLETSKLVNRGKDKFDVATEELTKLRAILSSMSDGVIAVDNELKLIDINKALISILRLEDKDYKGDRLGEVVRNYSFQTLANSVISGETSTIKENISLVDETEITIEVSGTNLKNNNGVNAGALFVVRDITEIHRLQQVRKDFVANVSHELRTPITAIKGYVETLLDIKNPNPDLQFKYLKVVEAHTDRITQIIEDLLKLARFEGSETKEDPNIGKTNLLYVVEAVKEICIHEAEKKHISIEIESADQVFANCNANMIRQALVNLLANAIRHSPLDSTVNIKIILTNNQHLCAISVADSGHGIPAEHAERIFERFYSVKSAENAEGVGLGLSIAKHIAQYHGGDLSLTSNISGKCEFTITLPALATTQS